ncbi:transposase [Microcoleus sp.]|uniref:REP-associated tyrosine transposase n=1 Tax=Microcoleus sp. TaxID=44472 RepID=UPI0035941546
MGRSRYKVIYSENQPHFVTCTIINWIPVFIQPEIVQIVLNSLSFMQREKRLALHGYVLMENHLHLIVTSSELSTQMRNFKSFTARSIIDLLEKNKTTNILDQLEFYKKLHKKNQKYQLWQEGFHPQAILNEEMLLQKLEYIHNNPVRRGYVDDPACWRYSSYRNYLDRDGLLVVDLIDF